MKKRVHKLTIPASTVPYKIVGISSHENDYRLSWAVNRQLKLNFQKTTNLVCQTKDNQNLEFSVFKTCCNPVPLKMNLISNRCPDGFLLNKIKNIDYILQIFGDVDNNELDQIIDKIRRIDLVSAVFELPAGKSRDFRHLPSE